MEGCQRPPGLLRNAARAEESSENSLGFLWNCKILSPPDFPAHKLLGKPPPSVEALGHIQSHPLPVFILT